jgi:hypothetical protein
MIEINGLKMLETIARQKSDGHLTIMKFTTNWRAGFITPESRDDISGLAEGATMEEAIRNAILREVK